MYDIFLLRPDHFYFLEFLLQTIYFSAMPISFSVLPEVESFVPTYDVTSAYRQLAFRCQASIPPEYHRYVFDITWYINNNKIVSKNQIPYIKLNTDGVLHRMDWDSHPNGPRVLGFWVYLSIYFNACQRFKKNQMTF